MPKFKKPLREKERRPQGKRQPFGPFPSGSAHPEARPVEPQVPGSKDRVRRRRQDLDPATTRGHRRKAALKPKGKGLRDVFA